MLSPRFIRYLIVGGSAYLIEMISLYLLHHGLGLSPIKSVAISFWIGFVTAFILQKLITFQNYEKRVHIVVSQVVVYSLLVAFNYVLTLLAVKIFAGSTSVFIIRTCVIIITVPINYIVYKLLFKESKLADQE